MTDRRFNEDEVAAIFQQASEVLHPPQRQLLPPTEGLTLAELQDIGREVGIAPELVAQAAAALTVVGTPTSRKFLGLPIGVGRAVELDRKLSDVEWEQLVVDLRETFEARGTVRTEGSFRQWTNGNLQVLLEPTANGQRIRMSTINAGRRAWLRGGLLAAGIAAVAGIAQLLGPTGSVHTAMIVDIAALAAGQLAFGAIGLPAWARLRKKQMEEVAGRLATGN